MWFYADQIVTFPFDFMLDGIYITPDAASFSVRNHTGVEVTTGTFTISGPTVIISIPAIHNSLGSGSLFENRFVMVSFTYLGATHRRVISYRVTNFIPMTVTADDVRRLTGLASNELPDSEIDLTDAYFSLTNSFGTDFTSQLLATDFRGRAANEAIALQAAVDLAVSLPLRVPMTAESEESSFSRYREMDWARLESDLRRKLQQAVTTFTLVTETLPDLFGVSSPTDPVTGE